MSLIPTCPPLAWAFPPSPRLSCSAASLMPRQGGRLICSQTYRVQAELPILCRLRLVFSVNRWLRPKPESPPLLFFSDTPVQTQQNFLFTSDSLDSAPLTSHCSHRTSSTVTRSRAGRAPAGFSPAPSPALLPGCAASLLRAALQTPLCSSQLAGALSSKATV